MIGFSLPVPHIYEDGSVADVRVRKYERHDWLSVQTENESIVIVDADHARRLAQALLIAASLLEK